MISDLQMVTLGISSCPGIGTRTFQYLLDCLKDQDRTLFDMWNGDDLVLRGLGLSERVRKAFYEQRKTFILHKKRKEFVEKHIELLTVFDPLYPELLKQIPDYPPVLYVQGTLRELSMPIAVVGTRKISSYGKMVTRQLTKELVMHGAQIISGFMYGVDTFAHESALEFGGYTIGILGYGFDHIYPRRESQRMMKEKLLAAGGALLSEYPPSTDPNPGLFPERNRIVAGISKGVLVTEAASKSGSKITANLATEYGRDVFAVPGPITSPYSEGTKELVNQGAKLVTSAKDILDEYLPSTPSVGANSALWVSAVEDDVEKKILELLQTHALTSDELCSEIELDLQTLLTHISMLELRGIIVTERGKYQIAFK